MASEVAHQQYTGGVTGELAGSATAVQMPSIRCSMVNFKAHPDNAGNVYIGFANTVTAVNGTGDTTSGFILDAGQETGWLPVPSLDVFWRICDNAGDDLTYMAFTSRMG